MTVSRRLAMPYAVGLCAALALGGCTGSAPEPTGSSTPATTTTSTPATPSRTTTATSAAPTSTMAVDAVLAKIPPAARPETMAGAEAFAKFYVQQINKSFLIPDPSSFNGLSDAACETCDTYKATAAQFVADKQRQASPLIQIEEATASKFDKKNRIVNVFFYQRSVSILDAQGSVVDKTSAGKGAFVFTLKFVSGHWVVAKLQTSAAK